MKQENIKLRRRRVTAAICAAVMLAGTSTGIYAFSANSETEQEEPQKADADTKSADSSAKDGIISGSGTVTSSQVGDELGMKNTSARLTVETVLAAEGDTVTAGTELYKVTSDSLEKAEKTLNSELRSAQNALTEQKSSYQSDKIKAEVLYESELLLGETAQKEYESGLSSLDTKLNNAYDSYQEAQDTVDNTPGEITSKQYELNSRQAEADSLQDKLTSLQSELKTAEAAYSKAAETYNSLVTEYNSAASVVRYLGSALGKDVSGISLAQSVSADISKSASSSGKAGSFTGDTERGSGSFEMPQAPMSEVPKTEVPDLSSLTEKNAPSRSGGSETPSFPAGSSQPKDSSSAERIPPQTDTQPESTDTEQKPQTDTQPNSTDTVQKPQEENETASSNTASSELTTLYEQAYTEYTACLEKLNEAENEVSSAKQEYDALSSSVSELNSELEQAQSDVSELDKEISSLETSLSKAKSSLNKLKSEYNSLNSSYEKDKLELKNKLDTDLASYENAEYHYKITLATLEDELASAQSAYDTAKENLEIFEKNLSDGYIRAAQDGTVYSLSFREGRSADLTSPFVYYVDKETFKTTVELDQYDVTEINIGDSVIIYSSETGMTNGKITAIAAGESTSLADVRFNVTVAADENASLYNGQSVSVYFNYSSLKSSDFTDLGGEGKSGRSSKESGGSRPDFGGEMPSGFDP